MTHLGIVSAAAVAGHGFDTLCFDADAALIAKLTRGELPVSEPDLPELLRENGRRQSFTAAAADLGRCDLVYISPDVPTNDKGESDLTGIRALIETVVPVLAPAATLVVLCQVPPGFTRSLRTPAPDRRFYQVETLVFGRAVERAMKPERYIIGCADPSQTLEPGLGALLD